MPLCTVVHCSQQVKINVNSPLFGACEAASGRSSFSHPSAGKMLSVWSKSRGVATRWLHGIWGETEGNGFVQPWDKAVNGEPYCSLQLSNGRIHRWQSRALPRGGLPKISHAEGTRNDGHKLGNRKFSLGVRRKKCVMEIIRRLSRLPRKAVKSLPLEIPKHLLDKSSRNLI